MMQHGLRMTGWGRLGFPGERKRLARAVAGVDEVLDQWVTKNARADADEDVEPAPRERTNAPRENDDDQPVAKSQSFGAVPPASVKKRDTTAGSGPLFSTSHRPSGFRPMPNFWPIFQWATDLWPMTRTPGDLELWRPPHTSGSLELWRPHTPSSSDLWRLLHAPSSSDSWVPPTELWPPHAPETRVVVVWNVITQERLITQEPEESDRDASPQTSRDATSDRSDAR